MWHYVDFDRCGGKNSIMNVNLTLLSFGHDVDFDEGGGWKNCKEYHICP